MALGGGVLGDGVLGAEAQASGSSVDGAIAYTDGSTTFALNGAIVAGVIGNMDTQESLTAGFDINAFVQQTGAIAYTDDSQIIALQSAANVIESNFIQFDGFLYGAGEIESNFIRFDGSLTGHKQAANAITSNFIQFDGLLLGGATIDSSFIQFDGGLVGEVINEAKIEAGFIQFDGGLTGKTDITAEITGNFIRFDGSLQSGATIQSNFIRFDGSLVGQQDRTATIDSNFIRFDGGLSALKEAEITSTFIRFDGSLHGGASIVSNFIRFDGSLAQELVVADYAHVNAVVMNVRTQEVTQYSHYPFIDVITVDGEDYGVMADGLYLLGGDKRLVDEIVPVISTGELDFGTYQSKRMVYAYIDSDTASSITPYCDTVEKITQQSSFGGRKTHLARGNSARYWRFKISGFNRIEGVEWVPEPIRQRRVK